MGDNKKESFLNVENRMIERAFKQNKVITMNFFILVVPKG